MEINNQLDRNTLKQKILSGCYKISDKRGRSKVWETFGKIINDTGGEIDNLVACRNCYSIFTFKNNSTSNLVKHKCYISSKKCGSTSEEKIETDVETKKKCTEKVTEWSVQNCRPFGIIEDVGLKKFAEFLIEVGAKFGANVNLETLLPHPTTISKNITRLYKIQFENLKAEIKNVKAIGYGLTSDIWTDDYYRTSFVCLTMHYVREGQLQNRMLGIKSMKGEPCTCKYFFLNTIRQFTRLSYSSYRCILYFVSMVYYINLKKKHST